jgi:hypothetical protein
MTDETLLLLSRLYQKAEQRVRSQFRGEDFLNLDGEYNVEVDTSNHAARQQHRGGSPEHDAARPADHRIPGQPWPHHRDGEH